ncbi:MAG: hypothetical protein ACR2JE_13460 [Acidobacteriaceae bacterium]
MTAKKLISLSIHAISCFLSAALGAIFVVTFFHHREAGSLKMHNLQITDSSGRIRGQFGIQDGHGVGLSLLSEEGAPMLVVGASNQEPTNGVHPSSESSFLDLYGSTGRAYLSAFADANGDGTLAFSSHTSESALLLGHIKTGDILYHPRAGVGIEIRSQGKYAGLGVKDFGQQGQAFVYPCSNK